MSDVESRSLKRAALVLMAVSLARWSVTTLSRDPEAAAVVSDSVLEELAEATAEGAQERNRRSRPLDTGERLDPNRDSEAELDRLPGVGPATARHIVAARDSVVFRRPEDLEVVRGIGPATASRLAPLLDFDVVPPYRAGRVRRVPASEARIPPPGPGPPDVPMVDVNRATVPELQTLPGIGPALAARIVRTREATPFATADDLLRVPGIGPTTLERLRPHVRVAPRR